MQECNRIKIALSYPYLRILQKITCLTGNDIEGSLILLKQFLEQILDTLYLKIVFIITFFT